MKRIIILANHAITISLFRTELVEALLVQENEVILVCPYNDSIAELKKKGCKIIDLPIERRGKNPFKDVKLFLSYMEILKKYKPDIVLTYTIKPNIYGGIACRLKKIPCIITITGLGSTYLREDITRKVIRQLSRIAYRRALLVMVQNEDNLNILLKDKALNYNYALVPGSGVNLEKFRVLPYPSREFPIVFNFIARVMEDKGIDEYLEAAKIIKQKYPRVIFRVIGMIEQEIYRSILESYEQQNIIVFYNFNTNLQPYIETCHCIVNPSHTEGMSNVLLEGSASGRPVIASDISGCREIVDDGVSGYLFEVRNTQALIEKLETFINLEYTKKVQMGWAGRNKVSKEFDRNKVVQSYITQINRI